MRRRRFTATAAAVCCRELISMLAWIIGGLFGRCLAPAWRRLDLNLLGAGETNILSQSAAHSVQNGQAVSEAQEKPSVSFI